MTEVSGDESTVNSVHMTDTREEWLADSGASVHVTNNKSLLQGRRPTNESIVVGNNEVIKAECKGDLFMIDEKSGQLICLRGVLYVPNF